MHKLPVVVYFASEILVILFRRLENYLGRIRLGRVTKRAMIMTLDPFVSLCVAR